MNVQETRAAKAQYMREYRQKNLEKIRAFDRAQGQKHKTRKLAYMARYRAANAEKIAAAKKHCYEAKKEKYNAKSRATYAANRSHYNALAKKWREENIEKKRADDHAYYVGHKEQYQVNGRNWYRRNPEKAKAIIKATRARHPEIVKRQTMNRRARKFAGGPAPTKEQIKARVDFYGGKCAYCGGPYEHLDHVKPLARGGKNTASNLRPSCKRCNLSKGKKTLAEWRAAA